ncbi:CheR family methyltransferase [Candidatus Viadribacter manganicus]|uniref:Chemotaxis protein methyltransferase n=1 Tax=Candidatus Viadribacter manganicus TaxID=1759059 RepID=A0A1B1AGI0_9PROT|nr:protein-glutamate O-methyltransferase CheR [Candidatus Viadribacter manganicus]ANP45676.1 chemotaxis protein [Candidatus Viadribacter manganicus]
MTALAHSSRKSSLIEGEYKLTARNFEQIAGHLREVSGISLSPGKATLVYSRLAKRLRKLGLASFDEYCSFIQSEEGARESHEMIAALTTNVTRFFREPHHFEHLRTEIGPRLVAAAKAGARVRLWSAACSSGEEPYSMALTLLALAPELGRYDVRILATDIDPNVVARGRAGIYSTEAISPIGANMRERWFERQGDGQSWRISDEARALVRFKELNLIGDWPMKGRFDVIFCRNVVIYFEDATQAFLWNRFKSSLHEDGRVYIGHSERIDVPGFESAGLTIYKLAGARP